MSYVSRLVDAVKRRPVLVGGATAVLVAALLAGTAMRLGGANFCLPMEQCHPDEHYLLHPALKMLRTGDFNPHFFVYPTLFIYILLATFTLTFVGGVSGGLWGNLGGLKNGPFLLAGRLTSGVLGSATLWVVYTTGRRLADRPSGALAALALAFMPLHVANSHFVTTDVTAGFFCALALWAASTVADEGGKRTYMWAGILAGMAAAAKYNAFLVALNIPIAHFINPRRDRFFDANLVRGLLFVAVGFLIACPYALFDLPTFLSGVAAEIAHYKRGHVGHDGEFNRSFYLVFLASRGFGPVWFAAGVYALVTMVRKWERRYLLLLVFPLLYLTFLGAYKVRFVRNLMPVLPYFALLAGLGASRAFVDVRAAWPALGRVKAWKVALPLLALALAVPGYRAVDETAALIRPDTRTRARDWIIKNIPPGTTIYLQSWSVDTLPPGLFNISRDRWTWDYYVGTDRLTRKYFGMHTVYRVKYEEVVEAYQHNPVAAFRGRPENPFYYTASPDVVVIKRDPNRKRVKAPPPPPPPKAPPPKR